MCALMIKSISTAADVQIVIPEEQTWEAMKMQLPLNLDSISLRMDTEIEQQALEDTAAKFIHELLTQNNIPVRDDGLAVEFLSHDATSATVDLCVTGMVQNPHRISITNLIDQEFGSESEMSRFQNELNGSLSRISDNETNKADSNEEGKVIDSNIFISAAVFLAVVNISALLFIAVKRNKREVNEEDDDVTSANLANHDGDCDDVCVFDDNSTISPVNDNYYFCGAEERKSPMKNVNCAYNMQLIDQSDSIIQHAENGINLPLQHVHCRTISSGVHTDQISRKLAQCMPSFDNLIVDCDKAVDYEECRVSYMDTCKSDNHMKESIRADIVPASIYGDDSSSTSSSLLSLPSFGSQSDNLSSDYGGIWNCSGLQCQRSFNSDRDDEDCVSFTLVLNRADQDDFDDDASSLSTFYISASDECEYPPGGCSIQTKGSRGAGEKGSLLWKKVSSKKVKS